MTVDAPSDTVYHRLQRQAIPPSAETVDRLSGRSVSLVHQRHYYTDRCLFEQSLDVYRPEHDCKEDILVLLTVGSGWMGHQPWVYRGTAWWNSSGPRTIASALHCPCVCIRHRGAYVQLPDWFALSVYFLIPVAIICGILCCHDPVQRWPLLLVPIFLWVVCAFLKWTGRGSAQMDDMMDDVATAIAWVQDNKDKVLVNRHHRSSGGDHEATSLAAECQVVFGGYSSGGHVSAMLLQQPDGYWKQRGLLPPHKLFSAVLYISGVLATQPYYCEGDNDGIDDKMRLSTQTTSSSRSNSSHSSGTGSCSSSNRKDTEREKQGLFSRFVFMKEPHLRRKRPPPAWLTNFVCRVVWGPHWRHDLPSPLALLFQNDTAAPKIPHLLIENRNEMFGLTWLDVFFCSEWYSLRLRRLRVPTVFRQVASDHWNILASRELHNAVQEEIPNILRTKK